MHTCMSQSCLNLQCGEGERAGLTLLLTLLCLWGMRCKPSLLLSGLCIYGIVSDMLADALPLVELGSCCKAKCLAIVHYEPALL